MGCIMIPTHAAAHIESAKMRNRVEGKLAGALRITGLTVLGRDALDSV